jgi:hypothetical protein
MKLTASLNLDEYSALDPKVRFYVDELHARHDADDKEIDQLRVQLAGCGVAALGGTKPAQVAKRGDFGWSPAYQDVLNLRLKLEAALDVCGKADGLLRVEHAIADVEEAVDGLPDLPEDVLDVADLLIERLGERALKAARDHYDAKDGLQVVLEHGTFNRPSSALVVHKRMESDAKTRVACGSMAALEAGETTDAWADTTCKVCLFNRQPVDPAALAAPNVPPP